VPLILFLSFAIAVAGVLILPGLSDFVPLAGPAALASPVLLLQAWFRPRTAKPKLMLIDGLTVLYWRDGTPQLDALREAISHLRTLGCTPDVVFDANAGYLLAEKYKHHRRMGALLGLPEDQVMVVDKRKRPA